VLLGVTKKAKRVVDLALAKAHLFHDSGQRAWAMVPLPGSQGKETLQIESKWFADWLDGEFYESEGTFLSKRIIKAAQWLLSDVARKEGEERDVFVRYGFCGKVWSPEKVYIDLGGDGLEVVEIDKSGWHIVPHSENLPIAFWRPPGLCELPQPERKGSFFALLDRTPQPAQRADFVFQVSLLLSALAPFRCRPFPIVWDPLDFRDGLFSEFLGRFPMFEEDIPLILGALCGAVATALRCYRDAEEFCRNHKPFPRPPSHMIDDVIWVTAAELGGALPWKPGEFREMCAKHYAATPRQDPFDPFSVVQ